jgi:hypothetical protein
MQVTHCEWKKAKRFEIETFGTALDLGLMDGVTKKKPVARRIQVQNSNSKKMLRGNQRKTKKKLPKGLAGLT